ncbi:RcnB family protein [Pseudomonas sp. NPDC087358]|uniref:RcnB family protein n=1 Tax=Pseudomonas sp. NPDC087358 TaxID=3364439 RepID=UPI0038502559
MNLKTLIACAVAMSCLAGTSLMAQAAQPASSKTVQAENTNEKLKVGDTAHDLYKQERVGIKDWQQKGLKAPHENTQWVQISDKYVLVQMDSGKILDITPVKK